VINQRNAFATILFFIFLVLNLCHVIAWSWWWVFAPIWGPLAVAGVFFFVVFLLALIFPEKSKK
jgi:hypothetical protein